MMFDDVG